MHRRHEIGIGRGVSDHAEDSAAAVLYSNDRADADRRLAGSPEVELMRCGRLELGGDDASDRGCRRGHA